MKRFQFLAAIWITRAISKKAEALAKNHNHLIQKSSCHPKERSQVYSYLIFLITSFLHLKNNCSLIAWRNLIFLSNRIPIPHGFARHVQIFYDGKVLNSGWDTEKPNQLSMFVMSMSTFMCRLSYWCVPFQCFLPLEVIQDMRSLCPLLLLPTPHIQLLEVSLMTPKCSDNMKIK